MLKVKIPMAASLLPASEARVEHDLEAAEVALPDSLRLAWSDRQTKRCLSPNVIRSRRLAWAAARSAASDRRRSTLNHESRIRQRTFVLLSASADDRGSFSIPEKAEATIPMARENSGKHAWIPVVVAIITSSAAIGAAYIGADARSQLRQLNAQIDELRDKRKVADSELSAARAELAACREKEMQATETQGRPSSPPGNVASRLERPLDERPVAHSKVLRVRIKIPPGYDQAAVYLDGTLKPIAERSLYWLELDAPEKSEPTFVRLEAKGRPTCEKLIHLQSSRDGIAIC